MVRCKGCGKTTSNPKAPNWQKHQKCYACARRDHPEEYKDQPDHGTGGSRMNQLIRCESLVAK